LALAFVVYGRFHSVFAALPNLWAWLASCRFRPPPEGPSPFWSTGRMPDPCQRIPTPDDPPSVIPATAGIQYLGMDSGSPFHSARNDGGAGALFPALAKSSPRLASCGFRPPPEGPSPFWPTGRMSDPCQRIPTPDAPRHSRESGNPNTSAWIPGLRFTPPGMTGERGGRYPCPVSMFPRTANRFTVIPAKAGIQYLGMDSGSPFHFARNDGEWGGCFLFPLCRIHGHGWRPAGFAPLPWGRVPFCLQQQKGTKKCRPLIPLFPALLSPAGGWPTRPFARPTQAIPGLPLRAWTGRACDARAGRRGN